MADRERVVSHFEDLLHIVKQVDWWVFARKDVIADAVELLKKDEEVEPIVSSVEIRCGNCRKIIEMDGWVACPWCGKKVKKE